MGLNVVFMGTPAFAVSVLDALIWSNHTVVAAYTRRPTAGGRRGLEEVRTPVHQTADRHSIPVFTPDNFGQQADVADFTALGADVAVVVAYGLILPAAILSAPTFGCLNVHASKLPRWRGAAPIHRAIMAGDTSTAVGIMQMELGLDTGPVCAEIDLPISPAATTGELHDTMADAGARLLVETLDRLHGGPLDCAPQTGDVTYASKISKSESRIDWDRPAADVHNHIRGLAPFPGAWFEVPTLNGPVRVKVLASEPVSQLSGSPGQVLADGTAIACGEGAVRVLRLQRAGGKPMDAEAFWRGAALAPGTVLD